MHRFVAAAFGCCVLAASAWAAATQKASWNPSLAAHYLDQAEERWSTWPRAELEEKTFCVSCHTASLYALARPALRAPLAEKQAAAEEIKLRDNVVRRIAGWNRLDPYYPDQRYGLPKSSESRGVEAVFNALVLAVRD